MDSKTISPFSLKEKLYAQITFNVGVLAGAYGLFSVSAVLGIAYFLYAYVGILLLMRYTVCPRCPHLHVANDCVQLHPALTKIIISENHSGPLKVYEKIIFFLVLYGILIIPLYWIASNTIILVLFLLFYGGSLAGLHLHFCKKCENKNCMQCRKHNAV